MTNNFKVVALYNTLAGDTTPTAEEINEYFYFLDNGTSTIEATAAQMMVDSGKDASFALLTTAQLVDTLYLGLLGKDAATDLEGKAYWIGEIETNPAINILSLAAAIVNGADATDEAYIEATFAAQTAALDAFVGEEPVIAVEGSTFELTDGADKGAEFTGTDDNDTFDASLDSARGEVFNTLSSADKLDGGAGTDTLMADLVRQSSANGDVSEVTPETTDIEIAKFNAADTTSILNNVVVQNTITVDAEEMTGVDSIGSYYSDGDLVIENLNTLTDEGQIRHTSDMTITMDHTDNFNTDEDASDLTVYFDEDYLNRTTDVQGSTLTINMINTLNLELNDGSSFIEGYDSLTFSVGDTLITVDVEGAELSAVQGLIEAAIAEAGFDDISVSTYTEDAYFGTNIYYETTDTTYNAGTYVGTYDAFILTNSSSEELIEGGFSLTDGQNDGSLAYSQNDNEAATIDLPISINVELEKVGQDAEGGNLIIGGKSNDAFGDTDVDQNDGIEQFDITVLGDEDRPSNLGIITSTNDFLTTVNIESETRTDNSYAALTVRGEAGSNVFGGTLTSLNANSFMGDLAIGEEVDALNINTFTATGGGDVELHETINGEDGVDYTITTANGEDELDITLNGDSVDTNDESVSISTGASADDITVTMDNSTTVSRETTQALDNLTINSGGGADDVQYIGQNQFIINTESGSDTVHINSFDNGSSAGAALGSWDIHASSDGATDADNGAGSGFVWTDAVLYEAELTLSFAGLEETVTIVTSATNNYIATQEDISTAIKLAIADNSELNRLLEVTEGTGSDNQITIDSTIDGVNDLVISIEQAVYNNAALTAALGTSQQAAMLDRVNRC